jgi:hypothetical protein
LELAKLSADFAAGVLREADYAIDSAAMVFAHAAFESVVVACLRASAHSKPELWRPFVQNKQVQLVKLRPRSNSRILWEATERELEALEMNSLASKMARLLAIAKPRRGMLPAWYSESWLLEFDKRRHRVVHSGQVVADLDAIDDTLTRLGALSMGLVRLVQESHGIKWASIAHFGNARRRLTKSLDQRKRKSRRGRS